MKQCIYVNGDILTMDERQTAQAVLVQKRQNCLCGQQRGGKSQSLAQHPTGGFAGQMYDARFYGSAQPFFRAWPTGACRWIWANAPALRR